MAPVREDWRRSLIDVRLRRATAGAVLVIAGIDAAVLMAAAEPARRPSAASEVATHVDDVAAAPEGSLPPVARPPSELQCPPPDVASSNEGRDTRAEAQAARTAVERYFDAIVARDGQGATALVADRFLCFYDEIRRVAMTGGPDDIKSRRLVDRMMIVNLRVLLGPDRLMKTTPADLIELVVEEPLVAAEFPADVHVGRVRVLGDRAMADVAIGDEVSLRVSVRKESGAWKIDATSLMPVLDHALQRVAREDGISEDELIFRTASALSGRDVDDSVYRLP